ncbi:MAG: hypothetical protein QOE72_4575 [Chloroflexota bacterium]|nr:hypothetical protein [Chloroflexota bacterium]
MIEGDAAEIRREIRSHCAKLRPQVTTVDLSCLVVSLQDVLKSSVRRTVIKVNTGKPGEASQTTATLAAHPV